jgi:hypothetical protein
MGEVFIIQKENEQVSLFVLIVFLRQGLDI